MKAVDLRNLDVPGLLAKLEELKKESLQLRIARKLKSDMRHLSCRSIKKAIARVNTILTEKGHH